MAFLKFLKKKEKPMEADLDVPPMPPPMEGDEEMGPLSDIPPPPPDFEELPPFPSPLEKEETFSKVELTLPEIPEEEALGEVEEFEGEAIVEKRPLPKEEPIEVTKPIFVRADKFKDILKEMGHIRGNIKENEAALIRVEDLKEDKEKEFEKWRSNLEDIQRKLTYADQALFKR
ncbi:hypothetical protein J4209_06275 [Candidatus Woesearchaeota archaeon]|nr:hypothetical protein [Candidatus Woesearchaeota archaeon]